MTVVMESPSQHNNYLYQIYEYHYNWISVIT